MQKVATVTFNPAIDETITVNDFAVGKVNRVTQMELYAGGKGVNVATFLADFGHTVCASGFLGWDNLKIFEAHLAARGIDDYFIRIPGATRRSIKVIDPVTLDTTDLNYPGLVPDDAEKAKLLNRLMLLGRDHDIIALCGSVPSCCEPVIYREAVSELKKCGCTVVIDTSGRAFEEAMKVPPDIIKPNIHELSEFAERELNTIEEIKKTCEGFFKKGVSIVVVSMGCKGALFMNKAHSYLALPPKTDVVSTVGAGDAMVAGLISGLIQKLDLQEIAKLSTAFSVSAIVSVELGIKDVGRVKELVSEVEVQKC